ncbi:GATA zinc finger domain-containing protein 10-like [Gigantopelta aegis]|uniref:GATA zinc finger domain-containing protein 10-like n=1 Tax=Gigantopelta aegis TaxID=1735272 RepID=UPI001B88D8E4|nr:GATA zinc finger domain-containing protein 10-like [Gigantopelta aegis]
MERSNDILKAIDDIEAELEEEHEMLSLTDESKFNLQQQQQLQQLQPQQVQPQQQPQQVQPQQQLPQQVQVQPQQQQPPQRERHALTTNSRFQPYSGTATSIQFGLGRGAVLDSTIRTPQNNNNNNNKTHLEAPDTRQYHRH